MNIGVALQAATLAALAGVALWLRVIARRTRGICGGLARVEVKVDELGKR